MRKRIHILAMGGTIAGSAGDSAATTGYQAGAMGIEELLAAVPQVRELAEITGEQLAAIDSKDITAAQQLQLAARVRELLLSGEVDGIVITHGTDTLEESAYLLDLLHFADIPVVITGAMRPATALSADGPLNILDAVRVAAADEARDRGVLVVLNNTIHSAQLVTKMSATAVETFQSPNGGAIGAVNDGEVCFYQSAQLHHLPNALSVSEKLTSQKELPYVPILYGHSDDDGRLVKLVRENGAQGIVYAGMGNGSIPERAEKELAAAVQAGIPVIRSSTSVSGMVVKAEESYEQAGFIASGLLNPRKARLLLQAAVVCGKGTADLRNFLR
ncbi:putative L-asparaginase [Selenomonas ruminantium subsp. lactilytica TAM6421]|uniref:Putative L-asparaginase n=1 Tax=Selenomonas ruminantium subsp. lactilytica (strain NBRC 103574 / TAM6421) TaxID=927704 RepID=I0GMS6_SELRL|nr:asparaginase [Selenomonas ruminantium]BAL82063.1 putative L-asparaginase [Selenomonas ruminantium subsp. lactilytica TAM6421]